ncbi:MAG: RHS repeat-associated core domain-containing protein, partial [Chloroflexi bacterium]|nr:RHS repeat-associated core domain-containing protein [Chloroflexota bacterium]MCL5076154.1 RHS repeat-associated core domain-containing protein [Chloroflexota bacterium]
AYTAQTWDELSSFYWYGSRAYDPSLGRFLSADTIVPDYKNPQSLNRYSYGYNNPVKYSDPTGHYPWDPDPWAEEFRLIHGRYPTEEDRRDREFSLRNPGSGPGGAWTEEDWKAYGMARGYGWSPSEGIFGGAKGSLPERLFISAALSMLIRSKMGSGQAALLHQRGTTIRFGDPFGNASAWTRGGTDIEIDPLYAGWAGGTPVEALAALLAHEAVHVDVQSGRAIWFIPPDSIAEEMGAFKVGRAVWGELKKRDFHDQDWWAKRVDRGEGALIEAIQRTMWWLRW